MSASAFPTFDLHAATIAEHGYDVLPIRRASKKPAVAKNWTSYQFSESDLTEYRGAGIGILTKRTPVIDADVRDEQVAANIAALVAQHFGTPPKRIGEAPKAAYVCQLEGEPFDHIETRGYRFAGDAADAKPHSVEILARGQQCVAYNLHPETHKPYQWIGGGEPLKTPVGLLPPITREQAQAFIRDAEKILSKYGEPVSAFAQADARGERERRDSTSHEANPEASARNPHELREALRHIHNRDLPYNDWVYVGMAIKGALGDAGQEDFLAWSAQSAKNKPDETAAKWQTFKPSRIGAGSLYYLATQQGWKRGQPEQEQQCDALRWQTLEEFVQRPNVSTHVRGVLPAGAIVVVFGPPKGGKTFSVCDLTMHAAHGLDWHGCKIRRPIKVAYLCGEGVTGLRARLKAWLEHHDSIEQSGQFIILPQCLSLPDSTNRVIESLRAFAPDVIVTDTLNAYFGGGDENQTQDMTAFVAAVRAIRDALGCTVVIIHHTGHGEQGRERGSIVLRASADVLIQVAKDECNLELVGFQVVEARDIETMEAAIALKLEHTQTEWSDDEGEPINSCIVVAANQPVSLKGRGGKPLGPVQGQVLAVVQQLAHAEPAGSDGRVILPRDHIAGIVKERHGASRQAICSAWDSLARRKLIDLLEPASVAFRVRP